jgi:hypothetical protein
MEESPGRSAEQQPSAPPASSEQAQTCTDRRTKERKVMSATRVGTRQRLDLHNASIDFAAATAGQCGFTHLPSGGICRLPHRHLGQCRLKHQADPRCGETPA